MGTALRTRAGAPVDVTHFATDVAAALAAFTADASYAVAIARAAVAIQTKRATWTGRDAR